MALRCQVSNYFLIWTEPWVTKMHNIFKLYGFITHIKNLEVTQVTCLKPAYVFERYYIRNQSNVNLIVKRSF